MGTNRTKTLLLATGLLSMLVVCPASAQSLRGKWVGTLRCRAFNGTRLQVPRSATTMTISQLGRYFAAQIEDSSGVRKYNGEVVKEIGRNGRFEAVLIECRSNANLNNYSEVVNAKGLSLDTRGRLAGESIFRNQRGEIGTCRWTYDRVSTKDPKVTFCR